MDHIIRLCPCPEYEIEKTQCWLEDMALGGWLLTEDSFFLGFAVFEKAAPRHMRYRLDAAPKAATLLNGNDEPDWRARELNEEFGWEYVTRRGQFYIYRTGDPNVPELHTDPVIHEESIKSLTRRLQSDLFFGILTALLDIWLIFGFCLMIFTTFVGTPLIAWAIAMAVCNLVSRIYRVMRLRNMRKRLRLGQPLTGRAGYEKGANAYRVWQVACVVIPVVWCLCFGGVFLQEETTLMKDYEKPLPFATLADLFPGSRITYYDNFIDSYVNEYSDILTPETYEMREYTSSFILSDGTKSHGILHVNYHRTLAPFLAQRLCWEYEIHYDRQNSLFDDDEREYIELGDVGADFAVCYRYDRSIFFIIRVENEMVRGIYNIENHNSDADLQRFCCLMADRLKEDNP